MRPGHNGRPTPDHARAARGYLSEGKPLGQALKDAGYSPRQARKGLRATLKSSAPLRQAFRNQIEEWSGLADLVPLPRVRANIIRARLTMNVIRGQDAGVQSAKLLGQDREVAMWEPDAHIGVVVMEPPAHMRERYTVPDKLERSQSKPTPRLLPDK